MTFWLHLMGDRACFARPSFTTDRVSFDIIPPRAARGIFDAIHWRPSIRWSVCHIIPLRPVHFETVACSNSSGRAVILREVEYLVEARFDLIDPEPGETVGEHIALFTRRAQRQRRNIYLGDRNYIGTARPIREAEVDNLRGQRTPLPPVNFGWLPYDVPYERRGAVPQFKAALIDGVLAVPDKDSAELFF